MKLGDSVRDRNNEAGRIVCLYENFTEASSSFASHSPEEWLEKQNQPFDPEKINENWAKVKCETGGTILSPVSLLTAV